MQSDNSIYVGDGDGTGLMTISGAGLVVANSGVLLGRYGYSPTDSSGTLNLQGGMLRTSGVATAGGIEAFNFSGGTLENAAGTNLNVTIPVNLSGPGTVVLDPSATGAFTAAISGNGSLLLNGGGTLYLSGTNGYTGGTTVTDGTLILTNNEALADGSELIVGDPASFAAPIVASAVAGGLPATAATAVPEPSTWALLAAGAAWGLLWRRKNSNRPRSARV
jgi:autotransporter-associated beta strand protein